MPYWRSQWLTALSPGEVQARLSALTLAPEDAYLGLPLRRGRPMHEVPHADDGVAFVGSVGERAFALNRCGVYDGLFRAELRGRLETAPGGTRIRLVQYLPWRATAIVTAVAAAILFGPLAIDRPAWPPQTESLIALAVIALMMAGGFLRDAFDNRRFLAALIEAAPSAPVPPRPPTVSR
jgi:hypothetical protein